MARVRDQISQIKYGFSFGFDVTAIVHLNIVVSSETIFVDTIACNQCNLQVSSGNPKYKNPKSIQEMGFYNSTMAISTGFTVGLNVNNSFLSTRLHI